MERILIPVDGSPNALHAVRRVAEQFMSEPNMEIRLLNVQRPLSGHIGQFLARKTRQDFHREQADKALRPAQALLRKHAVPFTEHMRVGDKANTIAEEAKRLRCDRIVMSTARRKSLSRMLDSSVIYQALKRANRANVPVEIVAGDSLPLAERFGVPAAIATAIALLALAAA